MKDSISRDMVSSDVGIPSTDILNKVVYDGAHLSTRKETKISDSTDNVASNAIFLYVKEVAYDPVAGLLSIRKSDGSVKTLSGFLTDLTVQDMLKIRTGERGPDGLPGINGLSGRDGRPGSPGCPGVRGDPGPSGLRGAQGIQGKKGITGAKGRTGLTGLKGTNGFDGDVGVQGVRGNIGKIGMAGRIGKKGVQGDKGPQGDLGDLGCIGDIGLDGIKGERGDIGYKGVSGPGGFTGPDGIRGNDGVDGRNGLPGPVVDIIGGTGIVTTWVPDADGNMVNKKLTGTCIPCPTTEPPPTQTTQTTQTTVTTKPTLPCDGDCNKNAGMLDLLVPSGSGASRVVTKVMCIPGPGIVDLDIIYQMFNVPDKLDIYTMDGSNTVLYTTGDFVAGSKSLKIKFDTDKYGNQIKLVLTGSTDGTHATVNVMCD